MILSFSPTSTLAVVLTLGQYLQVALCLYYSLVVKTAIMPPQVQSRPATADPLSTSRGMDKFPPVQHDPMHPSSCDTRAKINLQHREALRLALGSILAPKRPSMSGSRSSSGTASPSHSFSGSSGTYTPATPPTGPYTPSSEASVSQEHTYSRHHLSHSHYHPTHAPSKLGRAESRPSERDSNSAPPPTPQHISHAVGPPHPLFRSRSHNPSSPPSSRTSPRIPSTSPPSTRTPSTTVVAESADRGPLTHQSIFPEATTSNVDGGKTASVEMPSTRVSFVADPAVIQTAAALPQRDDGHAQHDSTECSRRDGCPGTPKAKFLQTLQGKSAWDALIHGSFS
ncbi:hypothetical protein Agabi119p4_11593 [Agaricus bisporus var. burnettii]|uniref:Uncharacterized protein n=1 Tax=Agaricus bisporus var. burnettii TaxID=192524 RepID=A0A8H7C091_AGABI|nr:hypothetical protein Agabi119p4_11593 [Agaricus bisporus var. burnettii]